MAATLVLLGLVLLLGACVAPRLEYKTEPASYVAERDAVYDALIAFAREEHRRQQGLFGDPRFELTFESPDRAFLRLAARANRDATHTVEIRVEQHFSSISTVQMTSYVTTSGPSSSFDGRAYGERFIERVRAYLERLFPVL